MGIAVETVSMRGGGFPVRKSIEAGIAGLSVKDFNPPTEVMVTPGAGSATAEAPRFLERIMGGR